jgi:hypothetical protein
VQLNSYVYAELRHIIRDPADSTGVGTAAVLINNVYRMAFFTQQVSGKSANITIKSVLTDAVRINSAVVTASTVANTDPDYAHMFKLCVVGRVGLDLFLTKRRIAYHLQSLIAFI